jgi:hypothetical protein
MEGEVELTFRGSWTLLSSKPHLLKGKELGTFCAEVEHFVVILSCGSVQHVPDYY